MAQDFINDNPEFKRIYLELSQKDREYLNRYLSSLSPEDRKRFIDGAVEIHKNQIAVEYVYAKYYPASRGRQGLTVTPFAPNTHGFTQEEITQLEEINLNGELQIVGIGSVGKGPKVRVILVMQKQVLSPVEVGLPAEGTLIIVQTEKEWLLQPAGYEMPRKTIRIQPSSSGGNRTSVDYDIGNGRAGSDAFAWPN